MRIIPRPKIIGAVFAAAALLFGFAVQAQATEIVYVSNTGEDTAREHGFGANEAYAQKFSTGGRAGGYDLKHIEVLVTYGGGCTVQLMTNSSSSPGTTICVLTVVDGNANGSFDAGSVGFDTSACSATKSHLAANTKYWVAMVREDDDMRSPPAFSSTSSEDEDSGAIAGWSIADTYKYQDDLDSSWATWSDADILQKRGPQEWLRRGSPVECGNSMNGLVRLHEFEDPLRCFNNVFKL